MKWRRPLLSLSRALRAPVAQQCIENREGFKNLRGLKTLFNGATQ
jgi:hypothetical protein